MTLKITSAPAAEPITLAELKEHLNLETSFTADDDLLNAQIEAARQRAEAITNRAFIKQTLELTLRQFPPRQGDKIWLPRPPLQSVSSITYVDGEGTTQTWDSSKYVVTAPNDTRAAHGYIELAYNETWPDARDEPNSITITYIAGYTDSGASPQDLADAVPEGIKAAIKLLAADLYEHRETIIADASFSEMPGGIRSLLAPYIAKHYDLRFR